MGRDVIEVHFLRGHRMPWWDSKAMADLPVCTRLCSQGLREDNGQAPRGCFDLPVVLRVQRRDE